MAWFTWEFLKRLKHTSSIWENIKELSSFMLNVKNMSKDNKMFNFIFGLQGWAQIEFWMKVLCDLSTVMITIDCLLDYKLINVTLT